MPSVKLEKLLISEVSGVDDPANQAPGWIVMKSRGAARVAKAKSPKLKFEHVALSNGGSIITVRRGEDVIGVCAVTKNGGPSAQEIEAHVVSELSTELAKRKRPPRGGRAVRRSLFTPAVTRPRYGGHFFS